MIDLYEWLRPSPLEIALRFRVFERVRCILQQIWPLARIDFFGSLYTGLFLPSSDIDVVVEVETNCENPLSRTAEVLRFFVHNFFLKSSNLMNEKNQSKITKCLVYFGRFF